MTNSISRLERLMVSELDRHYLEISYSDFRDNPVFKTVSGENFLYTFQLLVTTGKISFMRFGPDETRYPEEVREIKKVLSQYNPHTHIIGNYPNSRPYEIDDKKELYILSGKNSIILERMKLERMLKG